MDPVELTSLPVEVLLYLFLFLGEEDLLALCYTCAHLYHVMNVNTVWERFVTDGMRSLESLPQKVSPDNVLPDLGLCENRKNLMRRRRLLSNYRNKRFVRDERRFEPAVSRGTPLCYREKYVILIKHECLELWDISGVPELLCSMVFPEPRTYFTSGSKTFLVEDRMVLVHYSRVYVYQVNTQDRYISFLYTLNPDDDQVANEYISPEDAGYNDNWESHKVGSYIVCLRDSNEGVFYPTVHLWDIIRGHKVGVFEAPSLVQWTQFHSGKEDELILEAGPNSENNDGVPQRTLAFYKFNVITKQFNVSAVHNIINEPHVARCGWIFHKNCVIECKDLFSAGEGMSITYSLYDFDSSEKLEERTFPMGNYFQFNVNDDKLILCFGREVLLIELSSLRTVCVIPRDHDGSCHIEPITILGSLFLSVLENDEELKFWNVEKNTPTLIERTFESEPYIQTIGIEPFTNIFKITNQVFSVWHFW